MEEKTPSAKRRLEKKSGKNIFLAFCVIAALLVAAIFFLYPRDNSSDGQPVLPSPALVDTQTQNKEDLSYPKNSTNSSPEEQEKATLPEQVVEEKPADISQEEQDKDNRIGSDQDQSQDLASDKPEIAIEDETEQETEKQAAETTNKCTPYIDHVEDFFFTLDSRSYIHDFQLGESSRLYFPSLIQKLADNPPVVTGETNDLYTVLKNTAHFFRIIGKKNILVLKGILDREKETFEQTLADFYYLTNTPHCLKERFNLILSEESLYLYSGFFLNTMGGRLYLFRRDSKSRMVVNFYAILIIDQANRKGKNKYGIPLSEPIDKLIEEIESTRIELKLRDYYLDTLYDMKEKYQ